MHFCVNLQFVNDHLYSNLQNSATEKNSVILKAKLRLVNKGEQNKMAKVCQGKN